MKLTTLLMLLLSLTLKETQGMSGATSIGSNRSPVNEIEESSRPIIGDTEGESSSTNVKLTGVVRDKTLRKRQSKTNKKQYTDEEKEQITRDWNELSDLYMAIDRELVQMEEVLTKANLTKDERVSLRDTKRMTGKRLTDTERKLKTMYTYHKSNDFLLPLSESNYVHLALQSRRKKKNQ